MPVLGYIPTSQATKFTHSMLCPHMGSMRTFGTQPRRNWSSLGWEDWGLKSLSYRQSTSRLRTANSGKAGGCRRTQKNPIMKSD